MVRLTRVYALTNGDTVSRSCHALHRHWLVVNSSFYGTHLLGGFPSPPGEESKTTNGNGARMVVVRATSASV